MQNTTTSKEKPNLLFENFIISGLSQDQLMKLDLSQDNKQKEPEILFSMFQDEQKQEKFLQFIWPKKINIQNTKQDPKTHSFNVMDSNRNQTFFHCLIFTEEVCSYLLKNDFDANGALGEKILQHYKTKINKRGSGGEEDEELLEANKAQMNKNAEERQFLRLVEKRNGHKLSDSILSKASTLKQINKHKEYKNTLYQRQIQNQEQEIKNIKSLEIIREKQVRAQAVTNEKFHDIRQTGMRRNESFMTQMKTLPQRQRAPTNNLPSNLSQLNTDMNSQITRRKSDIGFQQSTFKQRQSTFAYDQNRKKEATQHRNVLNFKNQKSNQKKDGNLPENLDNTLNDTSDQENTFMFDDQSDYGTHMKFEVKNVEQSSFVSRKSALNYKNLQLVLPSLCQNTSFNSKKQDSYNDKDSLQNASFFLDDQQPKVKNNNQSFQDRIISSKPSLQLKTHDQYKNVSNLKSTANFQQTNSRQQNEGTRKIENIVSQNQTPVFKNSILVNNNEDSSQTQIFRHHDFQSFQSNNESQFLNSENTPRKQGLHFHEQQNEKAKQILRINSQTVIDNDHFGQQSEYSADNQKGIENIKADVENHIKELRDQNYVPVALVIQTKLEYHDHFRLILRSIYESIVNRDQDFSESLTNKYASFAESIFRGDIQDQDEFQIEPIKFESQQIAKDIGTQVFRSIPDINRCMAFAHMIASLSFLRTIPPPVFNSEVNILFDNKLLNFKESCFNEIPHKNSCLIKTILLLDFQTILTCLKALIFDKTLIVLSTEESLLFDVIEGFKQLIFPFTFDYNSFLPGNDTYKDARQVTLKQFFLESDGFQPAIFAMIADPVDIDQFMDYPDAVILHIDCSIAKLSRKQDLEAPFPEFPNEITLLQQLNLSKNGCFEKFGKLYPNSIKDLNSFSAIRMAVEIKQFFFQQFSPLLKLSFECINTEITDPKGNEYFNKKMLIEKIKEKEEDKQCQEFSLSLIETTCFVNFIDGYLFQEINNFDIVNSILLKSNNQISDRYKIQSNTFQKYKQHIQKSVETLKQSEFDCFTQMYQIQQNSDQESILKNQKNQNFEDNIIVFNYTMPSDRTCAFLFQRLQLFGEIKKTKQIKSGQKTMQQNIIDMTQKSLISLIDYVYKNSDKQKKLDDEQKKIYDKGNVKIKESSKSVTRSVSKDLKKNSIVSSKFNSPDSKILQNQHEDEKIEPSPQITFGLVDVFNQKQVAQNNQQPYNLIESMSAVDGLDNSAMKLLAGSETQQDNQIQTRYETGFFQNKLELSQSLNNQEGTIQQMQSSILQSNESSTFPGAFQKQNLFIQTEKSKSPTRADLMSYSQQDLKIRAQNSKTLNSISPSSKNGDFKSTVSSLATPNFAKTQSSNNSTQIKHLLQVKTIEYTSKTQEAHQENSEKTAFQKMLLEKHEIYQKEQELKNKKLPLTITMENCTPDNQQNNQSQQEPDHLQDSSHSANLSDIEKECLDKQKDSKRLDHIPSSQNSPSKRQLNQTNTLPIQIKKQFLQIDQNYAQETDSNKTFINRYDSEMNASLSYFKNNQDMDTSYLATEVEKLPVLQGFMKKFDNEGDDAELDLYGQELIEFLKNISMKEYLDLQEQQIYVQVKQFLLIIEEKQERSIIYGRKGLLAFLQNLFYNVTEKQKKLFNFYFNIKDHIQNFIQQKIITKQQKFQSQIDQIIKENGFDNLSQSSVSVNQNEPKTLYFNSITGSQLLDNSPSSIKTANYKNQPTKSQELFKKSALLLQPGRLQEMLKANPVGQIQSNNQIFPSNELLKLQSAASSILQHQMPIQYQILLLNLQQKCLTQENEDLMHKGLPEIVENFKYFDVEIQKFLNSYQFLAKSKKIQANSLQQSINQKLHESSQKQSLNKFSQQKMWFWIETKQFENVKRLDIDVSDVWFGNPLSYQEILTVMKFIINFENKNCYNYMLLQLFINFPSGELDYNQILNENINQYMQVNKKSNASKILENNRSMDFDSDIQKESSENYKQNSKVQKSQPQDQRFKQVQKNNEAQGLNNFFVNKSKRNIISNCLFPFGDIQIILDNLSRQQIVDLYLRIFQGSLAVLKSESAVCQEKSKMFSKEHDQVLNYGISQVNKNAQWCFPSDYRVDHVSCSQILNSSYSQGLVESQRSHHFFTLDESQIKQNSNRKSSMDYQHKKSSLNNGEITQINLEKIQLNKFILNPVLFMIQIKFYEVLYFLKKDMQNDVKYSQVIKNFEIDKKQKNNKLDQKIAYQQKEINNLCVNDLQKIFEKIGKLQSEQKLLFVNKRDTDQALSNTYFEVIDEREFFNCNIEIEINKRKRFQPKNFSLFEPLNQPEDLQKQNKSQQSVKNNNQQHSIIVRRDTDEEIGRDGTFKSDDLNFDQNQKDGTRDSQMQNKKTKIYTNQYGKKILETKITGSIKDIKKPKGKVKQINSNAALIESNQTLQVNQTTETNRNSIRKNENCNKGSIFYGCGQRNQGQSKSPKSNRQGHSEKVPEDRNKSGFFSGIIKDLFGKKNDAKRKSDQKADQISYSDSNKNKNEVSQKQIQILQSPTFKVVNFNSQQNMVDQNQRESSINRSISLVKDDQELFPQNLSDQQKNLAEFSNYLKERNLTKPPPKISPIELSLILLKQLAKFWQKHQQILNKADYDQYQTTEKIEKRYDDLIEIYEENYKVFQNYEPDFNKQNQNLDQDKIQENCEISKQIFYINLYNAMILFKLAELGCYKNKLLFDLKGLQSWAALEHNSRIIINEKILSAYQIRYDIVKNVQNQEPDNYHVKKNKVLHLIDYAFFKPTSGSLNLSSLFFSDPATIKVNLQVEVRNYLINKIKFKENFTPILLPCDLKSVMPENLTKPLIQLMQQWENENQKQNRNNNYDAELSAKQKFKRNIKLGYFRQKQALEILEFLQENIFECHNDDQQKIDQSNQIQELKHHAQKMIKKIKESLLKCEQTGDMSFLTNYFCEYYSTPVFKIKKDKIVYNLESKIDYQN